MTDRPEAGPDFEPPVPNLQVGASAQNPGSGPDGQAPDSGPPFRHTEPETESQDAGPSAEISPLVSRWPGLPRLWAFAVQEALLSTSPALVPMHLLQALLHEEDEAAQLVRARGVTQSSLRTVIPQRGDRPHTDELITSVGVKWVVEAALAEAERRAVPPDDLFLLYALLRDDRDVVPELLAKLGVDVGDLRNAVWLSLGRRAPLPENEEDTGYPTVRWRSSSCLGLIVGSSGVLVALWVVSLAVAHYQVPITPLGWAIFHVAWALVLSVVGGLVALIPRWRRFGFGLLFLGLVGWVLAVWAWSWS